MCNACSNNDLTFCDHLYHKMIIDFMIFKHDNMYSVFNHDLSEIYV